MARIRKVEKPEACTTREEFEACVDAAARASVELERLKADLKKMHQELDDKFGARIKSVECDMYAARDRAEPYFAAHAGELCDKGLRSGSTKLARFGVRLGNPTVTKSGRFKKVAWKALGVIFDGIDRLKAFVRNQPEVDRDAILEVFRDIKSQDAEVAARALEQKKVLDEYGIGMEQTDEFWIEPIADKQVV